jgi:hypothetical protein
MWLTLLSIICVIGLALYPNFLSLNAGGFELAGFMIFGGTTILFLTFYLYNQALFPISKLEQRLVPNLIDIYRRHLSLRMTQISLLIASFASYLLAALMVSTETTHKNELFWAWIIIFGLSLDLLRFSWRSIANLLNPHHLVNEFEHEAISAIKNGNDDRFWQSLDSLGEVAFNAAEKNKLALGSKVLKTFPPIMHAFYASSKSISRTTVDEEVEKKTGRDEASYTLFYLMQRLELIYDKALKNRLETICREMIMILGKIIIYGAKLDLSLVNFPTHFLVKFGLKAQQHHFNEVAELTTSTLSEIAKSIVNQDDLTYAELIEPFQSIINGFASIAKAEFQQNKFANIKVLVQPLLDLKELMNNPKIAKHRDTPAIMQDIDRALSEFETLEQIMRTLPPIPTMMESSEFGFQEMDETKKSTEEVPPPSI